MPRHPNCVGALLLALAIAPVVRANAQDALPRVEVHGFGSWAYGRTNGNQYLSGDEKGRYDDARFGLNIAWSGEDQLRVVGQVEWLEGPDEIELELDYAFAEWRFSDKLRLRAGKVQQAFGISTEVFDVGTLRPFLELPQAVYGPVGIVGEGYTGAGLTGAFDLKGDWELAYDVFFGGQTVEEFLPPEAVALGEDFDENFEVEKTRDLLGGHAVVTTPVEGLSFGGSFYTGNQSPDLRRNGFALQAEYLTGTWSLRSELSREIVRGHLNRNGFYAEAAYRVDRHWQIAAQYGVLTQDFVDFPPPTTPSLLDHEEIAVGLNYWWNPSFVLKLNLHRVDGNRFAIPDPTELEHAVASGTLKQKTNLVAFGAQFSF